MENFCEKCRKCEKSCPTQAIYPKKQPSIENIPGINQTRTCIDREKCYPQFSKTLGCSICMKVCPFSQGDNIYYTIKENFLN
ncbi:4Fe-4S double cluster binding domain-containing protein [Halothermothrix orenii]|uniref:4Fe-4S double cluster binding domain-containing protein n=1 Tax=Halothermothrix orenii TaxID=31909 RepID=UPI0009FF9BD5